MTVLRLTLRGVRGHLLRFLLTAVAVTLGVSLVTGTYVLTDSLQKTFDDIVDAGTAGLDVQVRGTSSGMSTPDGAQQIRRELPVSLAGKLAGQPGVRRAVADLQGSLVIVGDRGTAVRNGGAPSLGLAYRTDDPAVRIVGGRGPRTRGEVAVETGTLERSGLDIGDRTRALVGTTPTEVTIVGRASFRTSLAGASLILVDPGTARKAFAPAGKVQSFSVRADPGVSQRELADRLGRVIPRDAEAVTGATVAAESRTTIDRALGFVNTFLLVFAAVSLFVGAFIIANTFSMLVAQRTRELALLRAVGASRGQVIRMVLGEAAVLGLVGSAMGVVVGSALATGLKAVLGRFGLQIAGGLPLNARTVLVSVLVGLVVTLASATLPALRAARVPPVAAMRADQDASVPTVWRRGVAGVAVVAVGVAVVVPTVLSDRVRWWLVGVGAALVVLGALVASPAATRPVVRVVSAPFVLLGGTVGRLARENALRNPRRTAATAGALMIGLALMAGVSVIAASMKASVANLVSSDLTADFVLNGGGLAMFPPQVAREVEKMPQVRSVATIGLVPMKAGDRPLTAMAAGSAALRDNVRLDVTGGSLSALDDGRVLISKSTAQQRNWRTGSQVTATVGNEQDVRLTVGGVFADSQVLGAQVVLPRTLYERVVPSAMQGDFLLYVKARDASDLTTLRAGLEDLVRPFIVVSVQDGEEFTDAQADQVNQLLYVLYLLLALSVVIAVLGIVNTLALAVFERTREIGLLRAVGMNRRQLRRMITIESVSTAVFGAVLGLVLGLAFGLTVQRGLETKGLTVLAVPWPPLVAVLAGAAVAGVVAAVLPAWRAVRLDVLRAVSTD
jgi:putative ABC transport system permease protein